jgi:hypothetical protein
MVKKNDSSPSMYYSACSIFLLDILSTHCFDATIVFKDSRLK